jgi:predicted HicB family RNase H-like nuclease
MASMSYRGYLGWVEFDEEEPVFYGRLQSIRALVSYEATDSQGLMQAFHEAVDDYLAASREKRVPPEIPS